MNFASKKIGILIPCEIYDQNYQTVTTENPFKILNPHMFEFLKKHPFSVEAFFERSTVLTFAIPKEQLESLLPECLSLDTFQDQWGFVAIAMVQTKGLRPKWTPSFFGNDFFLIGYRIFVKYIDHRGKRLRGLYILKSETNKKKMQFFGNIFTHYNYTTTDIVQLNKENYRYIFSEKSDFKIKINDDEKEVALPIQSPFSTWKEARRFAGPLPFTFTYSEEKKEVLIIEGVRKNWTPKPIQVEEFRFLFFEERGFKNAVLANAFEVENVPYFWRKGKIEKWQT